MSFESWFKEQYYSVKTIIISCSILFLSLLISRIFGFFRIYALGIIIICVAAILLALLVWPVELIIGYKKEIKNNATKSSNYKKTNSFGIGAAILSVLITLVNLLMIFISGDTPVFPDPTLNHIPQYITYWITYMPSMLGYVFTIPCWDNVQCGNIVHPIGTFFAGLGLTFIAYYVFSIFDKMLNNAYENKNKVNK
ncbi:MAG TPA: hypothetical protein VEC16_00040 [Alphaproteobacteria bacterium]|nr:hypothetical protein [Alphaproteobacteria bacterium]